MAYISNSIRNSVINDAQNRCEYFQTDQKISGAQMHVEHIIPLIQGGSSKRSNLCLSCAWCNSFKGSKTFGYDSESASEVPLFNPRTQKWSKHFVWTRDGIHIVGLTSSGRATVATLRMNNEYIIPARYHWVEAGWHPPQ